MDIKTAQDIIKVAEQAGGQAICARCGSNCAVYVGDTGSYCQDCLTEALVTEIETPDNEIEF